MLTLKLENDSLLHLKEVNNGFIYLNNLLNLEENGLYCITPGPCIGYMNCVYAPGYKKISNESLKIIYEFINEQIELFILNNKNKSFDHEWIKNNDMFYREFICKNCKNKVEFSINFSKINMSYNLNLKNIKYSCKEYIIKNIIE